MQDYGETLIGTLRGECAAQKPDVHIDDNGDVDDADSVVIPFAKLTVGAERYEVARRFAAVLQLVNNGNVSIEPTNAVDSLAFHLLSIRPKFDIENYRAPSHTLTPILVPALPAPTTAKENNKTKEKGKAKGKAKNTGEEKKTAEEKNKHEEEAEEGEEEKSVEKETRVTRKSKRGKNGEEGDGDGQKGKKTKVDGVQADKENLQNGRETRSKRRGRVAAAEEEVEEKETMLRGSRAARMFEVAV